MPPNTILLTFLERKQKKNRPTKEKKGKQRPRNFTGKLKFRQDMCFKYQTLNIRQVKTEAGEKGGLSDTEFCFWSYERKSKQEIYPRKTTS